MLFTFDIEQSRAPASELTVGKQRGQKDKGSRGKPHRVKAVEKSRSVFCLSSLLMGTVGSFGGVFPFEGVEGKEANSTSGATSSDAIFLQNGTERNGKKLKRNGKFQIPK
jgi:hypothetical protein